MANPYAKTKHDGKVVDEITHQALLAAERILGYKLTVVQGSYNKGKVRQSAGTHAGNRLQSDGDRQWRRGTLYLCADRRRLADRP